jgi:hypothetical protein
MRRAASGGQSSYDAIAIGRTVQFLIRSKPWLIMARVLQSPIHIITATSALMILRHDCRWFN